MTKIDIFSGFLGKVSHMVDVRFLKCECIRADEQQLGC